MVLIHLFWHSNIQRQNNSLIKGFINVPLLHMQVRLSIRNDAFQIACLISAQPWQLLCITVITGVQRGSVRASVEVWKGEQLTWRRCGGGLCPLTAEAALSWTFADFFTDIYRVENRWDGGRQKRHQVSALTSRILVETPFKTSSNPFSSRNTRTNLIHPNRFCM